MGGDRQEVNERWCKVCGKSFPCGRSLGGHMRSHLSLSSPTPAAEERPARSSSRSCINEFGIGYGLRENPKKTWRFSQNTKKSLSGHMRCHSEKPHCKVEEEDAEEPEKEQGAEKKGTSLEMEPEADALVPRKKRKRSRRLTPISGSSSSASEEVDKEQEDVALILMKLSRDTDRRSCINSVVEAQDLNSVASGAKSTLMIRKENSECRIQRRRNGLKNSNFDVSCDAFMKLEDHTDDPDGIEHTLEAAGNSSDAKGLISPNNDVRPKAETKSSSEQVSIMSDSDLHMTPKKESRYECSVCNKAFNSYQSFGGHRASHIRTKGCAGTRTGGKKKKKKKKKKNTNNVHSGPKIIDKINDKDVCISGSSEQVEKVSRHKCPICSKVFSSSQALGGHKRSHLLASSKGFARRGQIVAGRKTAAADELDLNLPVPAKEGCDLSCGNINILFRSWCGKDSRPKQLASLMSN